MRCEGVPQPEPSMKTSLAAALLALSLCGCMEGETEAPLSDQETMAADADPAEWVGTANGGTVVTLRPDRYPVEAGVVGFHVTLDRAVPEGTPVSIDIVSPEMPAMGILRYSAEAIGPREYMAHLEIGMEGAWEAYVNLGDGTDAASFEFQVAPGSVGDHEHGGNPTGEEDDHESATAAGGEHAHGGSREGR